MKSATKPPPRSNRAKKPIAPLETSAEEPPELEPRISPFGDQSCDENRTDWHPNDEDPGVFLGGLWTGVRAISEEEPELNYNYIVIYLRRQR